MMHQQAQAQNEQERWKRQQQQQQSRANQNEVDPFDDPFTPPGNKKGNNDFSLDEFESQLNNLSLQKQNIQTIKYEHGRQQIEKQFYQPPISPSHSQQGFSTLVVDDFLSAFDAPKVPQQRNLPPPPQRDTPPRRQEEEYSRSNQSRQNEPRYEQRAPQQRNERRDEYDDRREKRDWEDRRDDRRDDRISRRNDNRYQDEDDYYDKRGPRKVSSPISPKYEQHEDEEADYRRKDDRYDTKKRTPSKKNYDDEEDYYSKPKQPTKGKYSDDEEAERNAEKPKKKLLVKTTGKSGSVRQVTVFELGEGDEEGKQLYRAHISLDPLKIEIDGTNGKLLFSIKQKLLTIHPTFHVKIGAMKVASCTQRFKVNSKKFNYELLEQKDVLKMVGEYGHHWSIKRREMRVATLWSKQASTIIIDIQKPKDEVHVIALCMIMLQQMYLGVMSQSKTTHNFSK
jgi:uncharacterized protein YxjI